jgi:hypothetical protein
MDKTKLKRIAAVIVGVILAILGLIWFLQGIAILNVCPVLCFADCECITGGSSFWAISGVISIIIGVGILYVSLKRVTKK